MKNCSQLTVVTAAKTFHWTTDILLHLGLPPNAGITLVRMPRQNIGWKPRLGSTCSRRLIRSLWPNITVIAQWQNYICVMLRMLGILDHNFWLIQPSIIQWSWGKWCYTYIRYSKIKYDQNIKNNFTKLLKFCSVLSQHLVRSLFLILL